MRVFASGAPGNVLNFESSVSVFIDGASGF
jgi:hypothetical protein